MGIIEGPSTSLVTPQTTNERNIYAYSRNCKIPKWNNFLRGTYTPCRRCDNCLYRKRKHWEYRMVQESHYWSRLWFITLTYRSTSDYNYKTVQDYLKRVRKQTPDAFAYVVTTEFESRGVRRFNPHHHILVFAHTSSRYRHFKTKWRLGYIHVKSVNIILRS